MPRKRARGRGAAASDDESESGDGEAVDVVVANPAEADDASSAALEAAVVDCARVVRAALGSGLTEAIYQVALCLELRARGHAVASELPVPVTFRDQIIGVLRADVLVDGLVLAELKTTARLTDAHEQQARAYASRLGARAVVINFGPEGVESKTVQV